MTIVVLSFLHHLTHPELHRQIRDEMACPTNRRTDTDPENVWRNGVSKKLLQMEIAALIRIHYPKNGRTDTDPENVWRNGVSKKLFQMEIAALIRIHYYNIITILLQYYNNTITILLQYYYNTITILLQYCYNNGTDFFTSSDTSRTAQTNTWRNGVSKKGAHWHRPRKCVTKWRVEKTVPDGICRANSDTLLQYYYNTITILLQYYYKAITILLQYYYNTITIL